MSKQTLQDQYFYSVLSDAERGHLKGTNIHGFEQFQNIVKNAVDIAGETGKGFFCHECHGIAKKVGLV